MSESGKYIYGVIDSGAERFFDLNGIMSLEGNHALKNSEIAVGDSDTSDCAYTISHEDVAAVVKDSEVIDYSNTPKDKLARLLVGHQRLVEKVMAEHAVIPVKLGTYARSDDQVREILAAGYGTIKDVFAEAKDMIETDVVVTIGDFDSFLREISQQDEIRQFKQSLLSKKGGVTVDDQMEIGFLVKKHIDKNREGFAERIQTALGRAACSSRTHDLMDDKMVFNGAFLVDRSRQEEFDRHVGRLDEEFEGRLNFRCVGPLPPYSFYTLEIRKPQFEEIDWARRKLGLEKDYVTAEEIKKAHRRIALTCHPDKNPGVPDIEEKFDEMARAYRILLDYYRAADHEQDDEGFRLNEEAVEKNAVLVTTMG